MVIIRSIMRKCNFHKRPPGRATGVKMSKDKWCWKDVSWVRCHCGLWHSNRYIPSEFWNQDWKISNSRERKKAGVILIRNKTHVWVTQSYHNCYGFPKGEKETNETVEECAKREFKEETGCSIDKIELSNCIAIRTRIEEIQYIFYIIHVPLSFELFTFPTDDVEITSFGWVSIKDVDNLKLSKAIRRVFEMFKKNIWIINKI